MPVNTINNTRAFVSLSVLAEEVLCMSRARVYELIERGALPPPVYDLRTRRPMFTRELQEQAKQVRDSGVGIDGQPIIFYRRRATVASGANATATPRNSRRRASLPVTTSAHTDLVSGLHGLGISQADSVSVSAALAEVFPNGTQNEQESDILRGLFRHFRRRQSA